LPRYPQGGGTVKKMQFKNIILSLFCLYALSLASDLLPEFPSFIKTGQITSGIDHIAACRFPQALEVFENFRKENPEEPFPYILVYAVQMNYFKTFRFENDFLININKAIILSEKKIKTSGPYNDLYRFLYAGALGYKGLYIMQKENILSAYGLGTASLKIFRKLEEEKYPLPDIYYALGIYYYYRSFYSRAFLWLPSVPDDRKNSYIYIKNAGQNAVFLRHEAFFANITMRINDRLTDGLESEIIDDMRRFPENIFLHYKLLDLYTLLEENHKILPAADEAEKLLLRFQAGPAAFLRIYWQKAKAQRALGMTAELSVTLQKMLSLEKTMEKCFSDEKYISRAKKLLRRTGSFGGAND